MKISTKDSPIGKPPNIKGSTLTYHWRASDMTPEQLVEHICSGKPIAVGIYKDGHRRGNNFIESCLFATDHDGLTDTQKDELIATAVKWGAFAIIPTFNSQPGNWRLRVLFQVAQPITDLKTYQRIYTALVNLLPFADTAAKDAARAFCGSKPGTQPLYTNYEAVLDTDAVLAAWKPKKTRQNKRKGDYSQAENWTAFITAIESAIGYRGDIIQTGAMAGWSKPLPCPIASHEHDDTNPAAHWNPDIHALKCFKCGETFKAKAVGDALGIRLEPPKKPKQKGGKQSEGKPKPKAFEPLPTPTPDVQLNMRYISDYELPTLQGAYIVQSPIDTGKTELTKRILAALQDEIGVTKSLYLTPRITLTESVSERLNIEDYQGLTGKQRAQVNNLAMTVNSLLSLPTDKPYPVLDVLFLDEVSQLLRHIIGGTFKGAESTNALEILRYLVSTARLVVALDAHIDAVVHDWLTAIREDVTYIQNTPEREKRPLTIYEKRKELHAELDKQIRKNDGVVVVACASRSEAKTLYETYREKLGEDHIRLVSSDNSMTRDTRAYLKNINEELPKLRLFIYTPSLQTGFDITCPVKAVFGIFPRRPLIASDWIQMLGRVRNGEDYHVWVSGAPLENPLPTNRDSIYQRYLDKYTQTKSAIVMHMNTDTRMMELYPAQKNLLTLVSHIEQAENHSKNNLIGHFRYLAREQYRIYEAGKVHTPKAVSEAIYEASERWQEAEKQLVLSVEPLDPDTHREKNAHGDITPEDNAGLLRWKIEETYRQPITEDLFEHYDKGRGRRQLLAFCDLITHPKNALLADRDEITEGSTPLKPENRAAPHKLKHAYQKRKLLLKALKAVWGEEFSNIEDTYHQKVTSEQIQDGIAAYLDKHGAELERFSERRNTYSEDPVDLLRWLLKRAGLSLELIRKGEDSGHYRVSKASLLQMKSLADTRLRAPYEEKVRDSGNKDISISTESRTFGEQGAA